ncbi:MAG: S16 family serine protease, partial [Candidatus Paceibacteria bacterium]
TGDLYISIYPKIGINTQDSAKTALDYVFAAKNLKRSMCDAHVKVHLPLSIDGYIDGPSGGAALAVMGVAALEGKQMKNDAMLTGTVDNKGNIGPVGGLYEKALIAKKSGLKFLITPPQSLYERAILHMIKDERFSILEARNVSEAAEFLLDGKEISTKKESPYIEPVNTNIRPYYADEVFEPLAIGMIALLNASEMRIDPEFAAKENLGEYFDKIRENERILLNKGYYFSAANDAFLHFIDAETIANVESLDVEKRLKDTEDCIASIPKPALTMENLEWVAGMELREGWAKKKMDEVREQNATLREQKYLSYHDAMYAYAWCKISNMLAQVALPLGENAVDEAALENLSWEYLRQARKAKVDADTLWHLENAERLHSEGKFAGAILDSVFVIEMANATAKYADNAEAALYELK